MLRAFTIGFAVGGSFPGILRGLFLAFPWMAGLLLLFVSGSVSNFLDFAGHPAIGLVLILGLVASLLRLAAYIAALKPRLSAVLVAAPYGLFYGSIAGGIGDNVWFWVVGLGSAWYVYNRVTKGLLYSQGSSIDHSHQLIA